MKHKSVALTLGFTLLAVFSGPGLAQQNHPQDKSNDSAMGNGMMISQMMTQHQDMSQLMTKMMDSMATLRNEKDPAKLKAMMAQHSALLDQMHEKMMGQGAMMQNMTGQMKNCPMMSDTAKPASK